MRHCIKKGRGVGPSVRRMDGSLWGAYGRRTAAAPQSLTPEAQEGVPRRGAYKGRGEAQKMQPGW